MCVQIHSHFQGFILNTEIFQALIACPLCEHYQDSGMIFFSFNKLCELQVILSRGYVENVSLSNLKMGIGIFTCAIALAAQFYPKKFPANASFLVSCIILYPPSFLRQKMLNFVTFFQGLVFVQSLHTEASMACDHGISVFKFWLFSQASDCKDERRTVEVVLDESTYLIMNVILQYIILTKEKQHILFTNPFPV